MVYLIIYSLVNIFLGLGENIEVHEFHLSRAVVKHVEKEQAVQISLHLYIDDFEDALEARGADSLFICTKMENPRSDNHIQSYLKDRFVLENDGQVLHFEYLGKEISDDLQGVWMYLEIYEVASVTELTIKNQLLTEIFDDQQNMMNVRANGKEHYLMMNKDESVKTLKWE